MMALAVMVAAAVARRRPRTDGSRAVQPVQGLHVSVHGVHRWWTQVPVQFLYVHH